MYVGLDVHKRVCHGTMMNGEGKIVKQERFSNGPHSLDAFMGGVEGARVVMEAGYCWQPLYDRLEAEGHDVKLAHPLKTKAIAQAKVKTDRIDSETLAHLLRADLVPESWVPPQEVRDLRELVKRRAFLVKMRTKLKNRVHAELAKRDITPVRPPFTRKGMAVLKGLGIGAVSQLLPVIEVLDRQITEVSAIIDRVAIENGDARLLTTIPGVGYYIALLLVAEIGDVNRFPSSEKLCSYAGLVPSVRRSGNSTIHGSITKAGSKWVRWALTQAVHVHIRFDTRLTRFYRRLAGKKAKQVAVMATARKMLKVVYWMLKEKEEYRP
ncbi:MAG: IS110 family transposase [Candidatus Bathyarchaeota archaeon]|nr:IS110 family transposase [Candidatus Bathyarchaeota archaeon]